MTLDSWTIWNRKEVNLFIERRHNAISPREVRCSRGRRLRWNGVKTTYRSGDVPERFFLFDQQSDLIFLKCQLKYYKYL